MHAHTPRTRTAALAGSRTERMRPHRTARSWPLLTLGLALVMATTASTAADPPAAPGLSISRDGASVEDLQARQVWLRCAEGMQWNGKTCVGEPVLMSHSEATAWAAAVAKADGLPWRLPRAPELRKLLAKASGRAGLAPALFPAAPPGWHWSSTSSVDTARVNQYDYANIARGRTNENTNRIAFLHGWAVDMGTGDARGDVKKASKLPVRLVRTLP